MRILFCGVGAVGSTAAVLCRNLEATLVFIDFDRVESRNLLAQAYVKPSVGRNKAEALKLQLLNLYGVKAEAVGVRLTRDNVAALCQGADLLVVNEVGEGRGFATPDNAATVVGADGSVTMVPRAGKTTVAHAVLDRAAALLPL